MPSQFEQSNEDRTEAPSTHRREEFRSQGTVAMSRDLMSIALLFAVGGALYFAGSWMSLEFSRLADAFFRFSKVSEITKEEVLGLRFTLFKSWGWMVLPAFTAAIVAALCAGLAQVGFYLTWEPVMPNWERLNPINGVQKLLSSQGALEAAKALGKLAIGGSVLWVFLKGQLPFVAVMMQKTIPEMGVLTLSVVSKLFFTMVLSLAVIGVIDYGFQRWRLEQQMRMTRREAKEEYKLREGDPLIKSRIKGLQRRMANRRMMDAVPKADVIVTNPTHLAVALQYDAESMKAPKVTAKGADVLAAKIRELAKKHGIPLVENKPLARTLYKEIEIGHYIPRELYKAVAEVLAYVYRLRGLGRVA